ncbi:MAG: hypothetical protein ACRCWG_03160 [Sarcina sp.]
MNSKSKNLLQQYGIKNIFFSKDVLIIVIISVISYCLIKEISFINYKDLTSTFLNITLTIGIGLLGVVITALSIIASMFSGRFGSMVDSSEAYFDFTIPFLLSAITWIILIILSILGIVFLNIDNTKYLLIILVSLTLGILCGGLKGILDLISTLIKLGSYKNIIENKKNEE